VTVGLIIGELVTNALKYAHPSGVRRLIVVGCDTVGETIVVEVADDGVGLPDKFDPRKNAGSGCASPIRSPTRSRRGFPSTTPGSACRRRCTFRRKPGLVAADARYTPQMPRASARLEVSPTPSVVIGTGAPRSGCIALVAPQRIPARMTQSSKR
jgi:hypothetical protein